MTCSVTDPAWWPCSPPARVETPDAQRDALAAVGCDEVFIDMASGKLARRPELDRALLVGR